METSHASQYVRLPNGRFAVHGQKKPHSSVCTDAVSASLLRTTLLSQFLEGRGVLYTDTDEPCITVIAVARFISTRRA